MTYQTVVLVGDFDKIDAEPATGSVVIESLAPSVKDLSSNTILVGRHVAQLDANGSFSVELPASDDPNLDPTGFGYMLTPRIMRAPNMKPFTFYLNVSAATLDAVTGKYVIELADILPVAIPEPVADAETVQGALTKANQALADAKAYTDQQIATGGVGGATVTYVDEQVAGAKAYTDSAIQALSYGDATVAYVDAADAELDQRLTSLQGSFEALEGTTGNAGAEPVLWGDEGEIDPVVTGTVYKSHLVLVPSELLAPVGVQITGDAGSGDVVVDVELSTTGYDGPWTSVFGSIPKPTVAAGTHIGWSGGEPNQVIAALTTGDLLRAVTITAPEGVEGAMVWRTPTSSGDGSTGVVSQLDITPPADHESGDSLAAWLFLPTAATPTWPNGWDAYGAPLPLGLDGPSGGPFYLHMARKSAGASEPVATVSFPDAPATLITTGVGNGELVALTSANVANSGLTASTFAATPSGLTTPVDGCFVVHFAMPRWTSGNAPSDIQWDNGLITEAQAQSNRTAAQNGGIAVAHVEQATAGAITPRTASWTVQARNLTASVVYKPSSGTTAKGLLVNGRIRATA